MALTIEQADGVRELVDGYGQTLTHNGTTYKCFAGSLTNTKDADLGGFAVDYTIAFLVAAADFVTVPVTQEVVTYDSKQYRIRQIDTDPDGAWLNLHCEEITRGA
jgi:hypothetical protein